MSTKLLPCIALIGLGFMSMAQTMPNAPVAPEMKRFEPLQGSSTTPAANTPSYGGTNKAMNANDVHRQAQQQAAARHGVPYYPPNSTPEQNRKINQAYYKQQMQQQYNQPTADNNFKQGSLQEAVRREMIDLLNESHHINTKAKRLKHYTSPKFLSDFPNYEFAKNNIKEMLTGEREISIKDAYFYSEQAYGGLLMNYDEFNQIIEKDRDFILDWLKQKNLNINDPEILHYGIQQFMSDTLWSTIDDPDHVFGGAKKVAHLPFSYDFIDYSAKDRRNYFVTKTLATGTGQCHTLPVTYLILAEALGVDAYFSLNPDHSFVRYKNNKGTWLNYETTIGKFMPDQIYLDMMPTMSEAYRNQAYIQSITKEQQLSTVLIDLAVNFTKEHWFAEPELINDCILTAEKYFPQTKTMNAACAWLKKKALVYKFNNLVEEKQIAHLSEMEDYPDVKAAFQKLQNYLMEVKAKGIEKFPEEEYLRIMAHHDENEKLQIRNNVDTKSKRDLFLTY